MKSAVFVLQYQNDAINASARNLKKICIDKKNPFLEFRRGWCADQQQGYSQVSRRITSAADYQAALLSWRRMGLGGSYSWSSRSHAWARSTVVLRNAVLSYCKEVRGDPAGNSRFVDRTPKMWGEQYVRKLMAGWSAVYKTPEYVRFCCRRYNI